jgi:dolichyl-phosphate beta-glucosyltransferase
MTDPKLSVVIPAFNEEKNLHAGALDQVINYLSKQIYSYEVLLIDDGSRDETVSLIEKLTKDLNKYRLIKNPHSGKAITVMTGLLESRGEIVLFTDMDQATPLVEIEKFFPEFKKGKDIVIGERSGRRGAPLTRRISAWGFTVLRNAILGLPFSDTQCGFKAFNRKAVREVFPDLLKRWQNLRSSGAAVNAGFDIEMLFIARNKNLKIASVPVEWHHVGSDRVPFLKSAAEGFRDMLRIKVNYILGKYN